MIKIQKPLHSTFYILHSVVLLALFLTLFSQTAFAKEPKDAAKDLKKLFDNTGGFSSVGKDEFNEALGDGTDFAGVKEAYKAEYGKDLDAVAKDEMNDYALSSYQEKSKAAKAPAVEAPAKPAPAVIPCPTNLPCIQPSTQEQGGAAIRGYILGGFGVKFLTVFLGLVAATSVIFIIIGGLQMHLAFGNDEAVGTAKKTLTWAIVGLVIAILSVGIVRIISSINL